jgi:crotonobetainyl-CoA:carnitine CoA-transferase CaiB-like acyl-CoA transferase
MDDPFALAADSSRVDPLLQTELLRFTRDELLERAMGCGATVAPVYSTEEIETHGGFVRASFLDGDNMPRLPFEVWS